MLRWRHLYGQMLSMCFLKLSHGNLICCSNLHGCNLQQFDDVCPHVCPHARLPPTHTLPLSTALVSFMQEVQEPAQQHDTVRQQTVCAGQQKEVHPPSQKAHIAAAAALQVPLLVTCMLCICSATSSAIMQGGCLVCMCACVNAPTCQ